MNTTHDNVHFKNHVKGEIPRHGKMDPKTLNKHDLFYQCS